MHQPNLIMMKDQTIELMVSLHYHLFLCRPTIIIDLDLIERPFVGCCLFTFNQRF
jgi:hypothetical protein